VIIFYIISSVKLITRVLYLSDVNNLYLDVVDFEHRAERIPLICDDDSVLIDSLSRSNTRSVVRCFKKHDVEDVTC
jgi:hypothetical protein